MSYTGRFMIQPPWRTEASIVPAHPQLRDLLVAAPETPDYVSVGSREGIFSYHLGGVQPPSLTGLLFHASTVAYGCGLLATGGQQAELALKSADPNSTWCYQLTNPTSGSINNAICIARSPLSASVPRLLVSNNDETLKVWDVVGRAPDYTRSERRRRRVRDRPVEDDERGRGDVDMEVEEEGVHDPGEGCTLEKVEGAEIAFKTAINHSSVSPDGRRLICVGDTNEVHLFDVLHNGSYELAHVFRCSEDAAFSSDWNGSSDKFAIASQDGFVHVYDIRNLPRSSASASSTAPRTVATLPTTQGGAAGAARKVKFSPNRFDSELLAFTEHRSVVHVVDARTFEEVQIISVPFGSPERPRPRASTSRRRTPHPTSFGTIPVAPASSSFEPLHPLPVDLHSEIAQVRAQLRRQDLQILADDMIAYFAPPGPPAVLDPSGAEEEEDCPPDSEPTRPVRSIPTRLPTARGTGSISRIAPASVLRSYGYPSQLLPPTLSGYAPLSALITSYQSNSAYFPQEANDPTDLLGLDWDEWGDKLFVATEKNVWEWDVDSRGRQCFGEYRVR